jgi:hypothetical protein
MNIVNLKILNHFLELTKYSLRMEISAACPLYWIFCVIQVIDIEYLTSVLNWKKIQKTFICEKLKCQGNCR